MRLLGACPRSTDYPLFCGMESNGMAWGWGEEDMKINYLFEVGIKADLTFNPELDLLF